MKVASSLPDLPNVIKEKDGARFVNVDHDTPLLVPPDLRDWVPPGHLVYFVMDAVEQLDVRAERVNERGTGDRQYPPAMLLGALLYSYAD